ncbi:MAG TPA: hypothetical protein HA340_07430 [Candidatus Thalassarchaeaceae archaeon]|nr:MAG TPA: hypothetical protein D7H97_07405 [Candidatus Poseidoniales archaeon]HIH83758.1 hypothetical protein [Candidatus Thalassarchaeaceae archaeon]|tara:strand:- start:1170 stop:2249 length:1080 start_codon:yes stop_codon:yes gene_type:complete
MARIFAFGAGLVGSYICDQLGRQGHEVTAVALGHSNVPLLASVRRELHFEILEMDAFSFLKSNNLKQYDLVLNLLPGRIGDSIRADLISNGLNVCDLAFSDISPQCHAELADFNGATMLHDCGIAPGVSNMVVASEQIGKPPLSSIKIRVGGNPVERDDEWSYCAPFSPTDVIEEYTRPARIRQNGHVIEIPAISDRHTLVADGHGEMEAFLTDGLRSLLENPEVTSQSLSEYTVRWPGHIDKFLQLRAKGEIDEAALVEAWKYRVERTEFTYMDITIEKQDGGKTIWTFDIPGIDVDAGRLWPSMAVATGIPFIVGCEALLDGRITGIQSPDEYYSDLDEIVQRLKDAGAIISREESE